MNSPFKFLDAYEKKDKEIYFGRKAEIELLYGTTFKTDLMLVYGQTGTGKTSLIQCGLANRFQDTDWFELYVRRGDNINASLNREIRKKAETPIEDNVPAAQAIQSLYLDFLKPVYLIFDQFEELFTLGAPQEQQAFFKTTAELLKSGVSCKLIFAMREEYIAYLYDFEKVVPGLFDNRIRIEPMHMANVEDVIRGSAAAFDIELEHPEDTLKQIIENNKDQKGEISLPYLQVYLDRLYCEAAKTAGLHEDETPGPGSRIRFTPALLGKIGKMSDVMASFLDEQAEQVQRALKAKYPRPTGEAGAGAQPMKMGERISPGLENLREKTKPSSIGSTEETVWKVLNQFVTLEGTRLPRQKEDLYRELPFEKEVIEFCLHRLETGRILRLTDKDKTYEIAHDTLAQRIDDKRSAEEKTLLKIEKLVRDRFAAFNDTKILLGKKELNYIEPYLERLKLNEKEVKFLTKSKKRASKRRILVAAGTAAVALITIFAVSAYRFGRKADAHFRAAQAQLLVEVDPTKALDLAETARGIHKSDIFTKIIHKIYSENRFYKIAARHESARVYSAVFSPDGESFFTGADDGSAVLWDRQGNSLREFPRQGKNVAAAAFSPDGRYILTGSWDHRARLWDLRQEKPPTVFKGHEDEVNAVAFSPDGKFILTGSGKEFGSKDNTARLWDLQGKGLQVFSGHEEAVTAVAFSPDGGYVLTGSRDDSARLWNFQGKTLQVFAGHKDDVTAAAFSPDGKTILTASYDQTACIWDLQGNRLQVFEGHTTWLYCAAFSPDGRYIITGSRDKTARLWHRQGKALQDFLGHGSKVFSAVFSPDGQFILTGSADQTARLWSLQGGSLASVKQHKAPVTDAAFSPDGKYMLTAAEDGAARLWDLQEEDAEPEVFKGHEGSVESATFSPDGRYILTGSLDNTARLWDLQTEKGEPTVFTGHKNSVYCAAFSPDGKSILTGSLDHTARLWDLQGNCLQVFKGHRSVVYAAAFSPDGRYILTGSWDNSARLWDRLGEKLRVFRGHKDDVIAVAFSPDGKYILTGSWDNCARLWDLQGEMIQEISGHRGGVYSVVFSPDGRFILTGSADQTVRIWDRQGNPLQVFKGHEARVNAAVFSPDGRSILTASGDHTTRIWEIGRIMPLEDFLRTGNYERFSRAEKRGYGLED